LEYQAREAVVSRFESMNAKLVELVAGGSPLTDACERVGVPYATVRKWIGTGRREPDSKYARFAQALDAARTQTRLAHEELDGYEPGPVERECIILISGRQLDPHGRVVAASVRAVARQIDVLAAARSGTAALGITSASRRLDELIAELRVQPKDAL